MRDFGALAFLALGAVLILSLRMFGEPLQSPESLSKTLGCEGCNVIILTADVFAPSRAGFGGSARNTTPNLDMFASRSVVFDKAFSPAISTFDSSVSLLSGENLPEHGSIVIYGYESVAPPVNETIFESLGKRGYATYASTNGLLPSSVTGPNGDIRGVEKEDFFPYLSRENDALPGEVDNFISELGRLSSGRRPFIAYFETGILHRPYDLKYVGRNFGDFGYSGRLAGIEKEGLFTIEGGVAYSESANESFELSFEDIDYLASRYDDKLLHLDRELGRIFSFIDRSGLSSNTIVIFTSYHGESLGTDGNFGHGYYFEAFRSPLIIRHPRGEGSRYPLPVEIRDLKRTVEFILFGGGRNGTFLSGRDFAVMHAPFTDPSGLAWKKEFFSELDPSVRRRLNYSLMFSIAGENQFLQELRTSGDVSGSFTLTRKIDWESGSLSEEIYDGAIEESLIGRAGAEPLPETEGVFKPFLPKNVQFMNLSG